MIFSNCRPVTFLSHTLLALLFTGLVACSTPDQKAASYYQKGASLLAKGDLDKAKIEFRNALQIRKNMVPAWYGLAQVAETQGDWQALFDLLRKVMEMDPKHLGAQVKLGRLLLASGQLDKALEASNKALTLNKDDASVLALRAAVLLKLDDPKGAVENANLALSKKPNDIDALVVLATERLNAEDFTKSIEYLNQALKQNDKNVALQLFKIQVLNKSSKLDMVEDVYKKLIKYYPDARELRNGLVQFYLVRNRKDDAENELRAFIEKKHDDLQAKLDLVHLLNLTKGKDAAKQALEAFAQKEPKNYSLKFALVSFYQAQNDTKAAEAVLREIAKSQGDAKDGLTAKGMLAAILMINGDHKAASQLVEEILVVDQRNEQALILKASMEIDNHKLDAAIADLRSILRDAPNSSRALLLLAQAHQQAGSPELADENYLHAFQAGKMAASFGLPYAQFLLHRNQPQRAEKILEDTLVNSPSNAEALKMLAQSKIARADWAGAQAVADKIKKMGDKDNIAEQIVGTIFAGQKNYSESISAFKRAYDAAPTQVQPAIALVRTYLMAGKSKEAINFLDSVLQSNPSNVNARLMQGQLHMMNGDKKKAEESFNTAIKQDQKNPAGYQQLSVLYARNKQFKEAETTIDQGLVQVPSDASLLLTKAGIYESNAKYEDAIKVYEEMLKERPDADVVANNLASLLSEYRTDKASLNRAFEISQRFKKTDIPQFKDTLGWASYKVGKYDDAKMVLSRATEQLPGMPIFHYHLGMTYLAKADRVNARKELEKALQLAGDTGFEQKEEIQKTLKGL